MNSKQIQKELRVQRYIVNKFVETLKPVLVSDIAKECETSAKVIHDICNQGSMSFDLIKVDVWSGCGFTGRYIQSNAFQPSAVTLAQRIKDGE